MRAHAIFSTPSLRFSLHALSQQEGEGGAASRNRTCETTLVAYGEPTVPFCPATTKAGEPCKARRYSVKRNGKRLAAKTCVAHMTPELRVKLGIRWAGDPGANVKNGGHNKKFTASDILRERFEAEADRYLKPLEDALEAMRAVVVGNGAHARIEDVKDFNVRLRAVEMMLDRIYGRPRQTTELSGPGGNPVEVEVPKDEERARQVAQILTNVGAVSVPRPQKPPVEDGNGNNLN